MFRTIRWTGYLALAAAVLYIGATVAGSLLDTSYSQMRQHVSDLTATGASTWAALAPIYALYNLLFLAFAIALYLSSDRSWTFKAVLGLLAANSFAGLMMVTWFREDLGGSPVTFAGKGHVVFASVSGLAVVAASILCGFAFRRSAVWRPLSLFSLAVGVGFILLSPLAVVGIKSDLAGLAERGPIGLSITWLLVIGAYAVIRGSRDELSAGGPEPSKAVIQFPSARTPR
jgi:hypothetical protein